MDVLCSAYFLLHWQILCPGKPTVFTCPFIEKVCQPLVCVIGVPLELLVHSPRVVTEV